MGAAWVLPYFVASRLLCRGEARCAGSQPAAARRRRTLPCEGNKEDSALAGTGRGQARGSPHHHEAGAAECLPQRRHTRAGPRIELSPASPSLSLSRRGPFFPTGFCCQRQGSRGGPIGRCRTALSRGPASLRCSSPCGASRSETLSVLQLFTASSFCKRCTHQIFFFFFLPLSPSLPLPLFPAEMLRQCSPFSPQRRRSHLRARRTG